MQAIQQGGFSWKKLTSVPQHVFFSHRRHTKFGRLECSVCHEPADISGESLELLSRFWNSVPEMLEEAQQEGIEWPILSEGEVSSLIEYLASVSKEQSALEK
jgi:hypothetical protein